MPLPGDALTEDQARAARRDVVLDGVCSRLMDILTGGVFLAGLGLYLGADSFTIGILASLPFLAQLAQFPAVKILRHVWDRKLIVILGSAAARTMLLLIAVLLLRGLMGVGILVVLITVMAVFTVISAAAWNWWMRDLLPRGQLGRFFGFRLQPARLIPVRRPSRAREARSASSSTPSESPRTDGSSWRRRSSRSPSRSRCPSSPCSCCALSSTASPPSRWSRS
ncbi:MAG: hypothetical protein HYT80_10360 [Euryarchaeota archaeon]|nr:hypothetical protein [Euryarchaeota archaeon]